MQLDQFLLILRILFIVLLYLFLMQVVIAITRDLRKTSVASADEDAKGPRVVGHLVVVDKGPTSIMPGARFDLEADTIIGRSPTSTIQIPENFVSTEHARLRYRNGVWHVKDLDSQNGTFVNDQQLQPNEEARAKLGDLIAIGYIRFRLMRIVGELVVVDSGPSNIARGTHFNLEAETRIGSGPGNTLQIPERFVSSEHTLLTYRDGVWSVRDLGSRTGTFVNSQQVGQDKAIRAQPGDVISVGHLRFELTQL